MKLAIARGEWWPSGKVAALGQRAPGPRPPLHLWRAWGLLHAKSYAEIKRPPSGVARKLGERRGSQLRRRPHHLTAVQNYKMSSKRTLTFLQNGVLI
ncbi:hypothetical protein AVEN_84574-1 [Araneus ventricosus]|uniref:Uncharacterized protein n=1 Tax=Araneus ventricosus TaxID=182803 RepID=A0A4Y2C2T2_ARAVE|nr:hypothetical protein AVEN_84574-1 [Araneus ventricosus]